MIRSVYLMLGQECNFSCRYCIQHELFVNEVPRSEINYDVVDFLKKLGHRPLLQFWGGEPLVYFKDIEYLVGQLGSTFDYSIITNGALLTEEIVDFINAKDIWLTVSNDGPNTVNYRNFNVLEDENIVKAIGKYKRTKSFSAVISAENYDVKSIYNYISSKFEDSYINYDFILASEHTPSDLVNFDMEKFEKYFSEYFIKVADEIVAGSVKYQDLLFFNSLAKDFNAQYKLGEFSCNAYTSTLNIDLLGNVYKCHNSGEVIGQINSLDSIKKYEYSIEHLAYCQGCECLRFCKMGCILMPLDLKRGYFCKLKKALYKYFCAMEKSLLC